MKAYVNEIQSPAGPLAFAVDEDGALMRLHFVESDYGSVIERDLEDEGYAVEVDEAKTAGVRAELSEYANGKRKTFDVPLAFAGSEWQKTVWRELTRMGGQARPGPSVAPTPETSCPSSYRATALSPPTARSAVSTAGCT